MFRAFRLLVLVGLLFSAGCSSFPALPLLATPTPAPDKQVTSTPQVIPTQTALPGPEARILRVWLPPRFDPNAGTSPANLLKQRLADFESQHPGLVIDVRIKAEDGDTSLLNSLSITSNAAPTALPDLVALPRPALEAAALKGLLHPIDGLSTLLQDPNWYGYARDLGHIQNIGYGLPFAGDAMVLIYNEELEGGVLWENIFASKRRLSFPAGDPQGLFGLSLYISAGGEVVDSSGLPMLDQVVLTRVLTLVQEGVFAGTLLPSLKNVLTEEQVKASYRAGDVDMAILWASTLPATGFIAPVPGLDNSGYSFATGWVWALAGSKPEYQQLAIELAEFLIEDNFLSAWLQDDGFLPVRVSAASAATASTFGPVIESAQVIPSNNALEVLSPLLQEALVRVLNNEPPEVVAGSVTEKLKK